MFLVFLLIQLQLFQHLIIINVVKVKVTIIIHVLYYLEIPFDNDFNVSGPNNTNATTNEIAISAGPSPCINYLSIRNLLIRNL